MLYIKFILSIPITTIFLFGISQKIIYPPGNYLSCATTGNLLTERIYHTSLVSHIK